MIVKRKPILKGGFDQQPQQGANPNFDALQEFREQQSVKFPHLTIPGGSQPQPQQPIMSPGFKTPVPMPGGNGMIQPDIGTPTPMPGFNPPGSGTPAPMPGGNGGFNQPQKPNPVLGGGKTMPMPSPGRMPQPNPRRNLIPRPIDPRFKMM